MDNSIGAFLFFVIVNAGVAYRRGYNPFVWALTASAIGTIVLYTLPSVKEEKNEELQIKLKKRGNKIGFIVIGVSIVVGVAISLFLQVLDSSNIK